MLRKRKSAEIAQEAVSSKKLKDTKEYNFFNLVTSLESIQKDIFKEIGRLPKTSISRKMTQENLTTPYINFIKLHKKDSKMSELLQKAAHFPFFEKLLQDLLNVEFKRKLDKDESGLVFKNLVELHESYKEKVVKFETFICSINERYQAKVKLDEFSTKIKNANLHKKIFVAKKHGVKFFADAPACLIRPSAKKKALKPSSRVPK